MKIFEKIDSILFFIAKISIFICMFVITFNAVGRYLFNKPITGSYEFTEIYLMIIMIFLSLSYTWKTKGLIAVDILSNKFRKSVKNIVYFFILIAGIAFFGLMGYEAFLSTVESFVRQERVSGIIPWPRYLSTIWIPIGCLMIVLRMISEMISGIIKFRNAGIRSKIFPHDRLT